MEQVTGLVDAGGGTETLSKNLPDLPESLESFLDEQKEKPTELKLIDSDILALASQVGDEMEDSGEGSLSTDLSFLEGAVAKETGDEEDDPALSFFVGDVKMEVANDDLAFLEEQGLSEEESYSENEDESLSNEDESEEDEEEEEEESSNDNEDLEQQKEDESDDKKDDDIDDEGVFGQVSFYDDESTPSELVEIKTKKKKTPKDSVKKKKLKKKRKAKDDKYDRDAKPAKKKRRQKRKPSNEDEEDDDVDDNLLKSGASLMRRKNIRSILSEKDLDKEMLSAQNEELERQKRLMELKKSLLRDTAGIAAAAAVKVIVPSMASAGTSTSIVTTKTATASTGTSTSKEKDSQLKSLLQVAEEEAEKEAETKERKKLDKEVIQVKRETRETSPPSDVITLSSDSDDSDDLDDDSDEVVMVPSDEGEEDDENPEDVNNAGAHIDDTLNLPDPDGRVKINIGHPPDDPDIYLAPQIAQAIKPHQIGGVRFLYDNLVESLERFRTTPGFGCILAHSMGLGKTIQLISFIDIFLRFTGGKHVMCIVPINTLQNWLAEFNYWLPPQEKLHPDDTLTQTRTFPLFIINDAMKTTAVRAAVIEKWKKQGGVMLMGYEMFRLLSSKRVVPSKAKSRSKKSSQPEVIDVEEEDKNKSLMIDMHSMLVDPGPDLVMCDEGHRIKNSSAAISQALKNIKSRRRVVLTGYPLQNNLMEYWCMVDFVRPNFLGTKTEFSNMFERPIMNGQCLDSTALDKKLMRHRSYVLHNLLEGFVQRRGHTVLQLSLPPKTENVLLVRLSPIQHKIYCEFMNAISESGLCSWANNNPLKAFAVCCKIWNHPDILHDVLTQHIADKDNDLDIDTGEGGSANKKTKKPLPKSASSTSLASADSTPSLAPSASTTSLTSMASESGPEKNPITYDWAESLMKDYIPGVLENSGKFILMSSIVEECLAVGDKVLIFSQSLLTLNKIEEFLGKLKVPRMEINETWQRNRTYFRLDGSTSAQDREKLINQFNDPESPIWVFLLSTKAGCLGINLIAANRVIVIDASWNPCHDCQAICRVYRFGQIKNTYVYRLITDNTLEKRIYDRQINKQGMSDRIVDDMNPENKLTRRQVENLLDFEDQEFPVLDFSNVSHKYGLDQVLMSVLHKYGQWLTKQPFTHESLLIDQKELRLTKREKRLAKEGYARDKRMNLTYTRPSYAAYYPQVAGLPNRLPLNSRYNYAQFRRGPIVRPIASVRPMIAANVQNGGEKIKQFGGQPLRPGVTIHQVITTTEIVLPGTNTGTQAGTVITNKIGAGEKILVIKTPKGVYIRTNDGKMFAVRSKTGGAIGEVGGSNLSVSTTTTTTLTTAGGNQVFVTPNLTMTTASGKKPPIIIVSNKKGVPITMARGGSIIRTLPYGSANLLSTLKPSLLKAGLSKMIDSTTTTSSTSIQASTNASSSKSGTSLANLIISDDSDEAGNEKKMSDGATQSEVKPKMPVIVLPSLAVRTPRPVSSLQSSTVATTSPGGGTVVIMPTKPVVSMGTKRAPKNTKSKKSKAKDRSAANSVGVGTDAANTPEELKKKGVSLLMNMNVVSSTGTISTASISKTATSNTSTGIPGTSQTQNLGPAVSVSSSSSQIDINSSQSSQQQLATPAFPDLNSMWQSNFGTGPPMGNSASQTSHGPTSTAASAVSANTVVNSGNSSNKYSAEMLLPNQNQESMMGSNDNSSNQNMMGVGSQAQNKSDSFGHQFNSSQRYNNMNNPYMSSPVGSYNMGGSMMGQSMGAMQNHMSPYISGMHQGYMQSPPSGPFSQSLPPPPPPPAAMSNQSQGPSGNMMYGHTQSPSSSQFRSSFSPSNQQNPAPFGTSVSGNTSFQGAETTSPFGFSSSMGGMSYGVPTTSSSFMSQPQTDPGFPQPQASMPFYPPHSTSPMYSIDSVSSNSYSQQNQPQQQLSISSSSSVTSTTPTLQDSGLGSLDRSSRDNSPFPLTMLGPESSGSMGNSNKSSQNQRTKSTSSKKSKVPASSSRTNSPSVNKSQGVNKQQGSSVPSPAPSPRHAANTPDNNKSFMDISNSRPNNNNNTQSNNSNSISQGFGSNSQDSSGSNSSFNVFDSSSNSMGNSYSGNNVGFGSLSGLSVHGMASDLNMGGSAFRAHPSSLSNNLPVNPQPFRLDGASGMGNSNSSGLHYNSGMSAFSTPSTLSSTHGVYGASPSFGSYGSGYGGSTLPFPSSPMMPPPQSMMGYPQTALGYPGMSPFAPAPPAPTTMGGSMWPMMPPSMMGGGYNYPAHPTSMGFSPPGLDSQGFGHLGPGPGSGL